MVNSKLSYYFILSKIILTLPLIFNKTLSSRSVSDYVFEVGLANMINLMI